MPYGIRSMEEQLDEHRKEGFTVVHIDTCLGCYLSDHHNRDGELLLGVYVDGDSTVESVLDGLADEFRQIGFELGESRKGYDHDKAWEAIQKVRADNADKLGELFDASLEIPSDDDELDGGDYVQAWFLIVWPVPDEEEVPIADA